MAINFGKIIKKVLFQKFKLELLKKPRFSFLEGIRFHSFIRIETPEKIKSAIVFTLPQIKKLALDLNKALEDIEKIRTGSKRKIDSGVKRMAKMKAEIEFLEENIELAQKEIEAKDLLQLNKNEKREYLIATLNRKIREQAEQIKELNESNQLAQRNNDLLSSRIPEISDENQSSPRISDVYGNPLMKAQPGLNKVRRNVHRR